MGILSRETVHNYLSTLQVHTKEPDERNDAVAGYLSAVSKAVNSTVHTSIIATPTQLVFRCNAFLPVAFMADWTAAPSWPKQCVLGKTRNINPTHTRLAIKSWWFAMIQTANTVLTPVKVHSILQKLMHYAKSWMLKCNVNDYCETETKLNEMQNWIAIHNALKTNKILQVGASNLVCRLYVGLVLMNDCMNVMLIPRTQHDSQTGKQ